MALGLGALSIDGRYVGIGLDGAEPEPPELLP